MISKFSYYKVLFINEIIFHLHFTHTLLFLARIFMLLNTAHPNEGFSLPLYIMDLSVSIFIEEKGKRLNGGPIIGYCKKWWTRSQTKSVAAGRIAFLGTPTRA